MSASCNTEFSDSTGDSSDSKKALPLKKSPPNTQFFAYALLSLAKHAVVSRKSANQLILLQPIGSSTAHHPQYCCGAFAVI